MNIKNKLEKNIPGKIVKLLKEIGEISKMQNTRSYIVGGFVRDLLLGIKNYDIDIVSENNGISVAIGIAKKKNAKIIIHENFGTATVIMKKFFSKDKLPFRIDFSTAREECYKKPGALPDVKFSNIKEDLRRRDFTINAIATSIMEEDFGNLVDFFGGISDLKEKTIKVLHAESFKDDPTRIFRAIRFEQRFNFKIEPKTEKLIRQSIGQKSFKTISRERIGGEIILLLKEKSPGKSIKRMADLNELRFIHPKIKFTENISEAFDQAPVSMEKINKLNAKTCICDKKYLVYFMILLKDLPPNITEKLCNSFSFPKEDKQKIVAYSRKQKKCVMAFKSKKIPKSVIYQALSKVAPEGIAAILAEFKNKTRIFNAIRNYIEKTSQTKLYITGNTLKEIGFNQGPIISSILKKILYAKIDGKIKTKKQEIEMAYRLKRSAK